MEEKVSSRGQIKEALRNYAILVPDLTNFLAIQCLKRISQ